jgi:hypothetical protein
MAWWSVEGREFDRPRRALCLRRLAPLSCKDPFAAVILWPSQSRQARQQQANVPKNPAQTPVPNGKLRHFKGSTASGVIDPEVTHPAAVRLAGGNKV